MSGRSREETRGDEIEEREIEIFLELCTSEV